MSGVGVSGLIANLPATVTPYPTQDPALELGGYRSVANAAARDAIPANFRAIGMQVTLQDTGVSYQLVGGILNANWQAGGGAAQPFKAAFYVDPTFAGVQLGSSANPLTTIAAAFAMAASLGITSGIIYIPQATVTENVTFPVTGNWEIASLDSWGYFAATINGTVDITCTATARHAFTNVAVSGAITGNAPTGTFSRVKFNNCSLAAVTLTASGTGGWRAGFCSMCLPGTVGMGGASNGAVSIAGDIIACLWAFAAAVSCTGSAWFDFCSGSGTAYTSTAPGAASWQLTECFFNAGTTFSATTGPLTVRVDDTSALSGANLAAGANATLVAFAGPYFATYWVDPAFGGVQFGTQSNPYRTIAQAFAAAAALGITSGIVYIPQTTVSENVTFPVTGNWEIASLDTWGFFAATISGTVDITCTATARRALTNIAVSGTVSGNAPTGTFSRARFTNCALAAVALTASGTGGWRTGFTGTCLPATVGMGGSASGAVSITGDIAASLWAFSAAVACTGSAWFDQCGGTGVAYNSSAPGAATWRLTDCQFNANTAFSATTGPLTVLVDQITQTSTTGLVPGANASFSTGWSNRRTIAANLGTTTLVSGALPPGQYTATATLTVLVAGTLGTAVANIIYTDLLGVVQTKPIGAGVNITGAAGTEVSAKFTFCSTGAGGLSFSVTGITTPGALSLSVATKVAAEY